MKMTKLNRQPRLHPFDWLLEAISVLLVFILFFIPIYLIGDLPQEIPVHFNFLGEPDGYGNKQTVSVMVGTGFFTYLSITILTFYDPMMGRFLTLADRPVEPKTTVQKETPCNENTWKMQLNTVTLGYVEKR